MADQETRTTAEATRAATGDGEGRFERRAVETPARPAAAPAAPLGAPATQVSGLYVRDPLPPGVNEELRIDVDGRYPQRIASGTVWSPVSGRMHWVADVEKTGPNTWSGPIFYEDSPSFKFRWDSVKIDLTPGTTPDQNKAKLSMNLPGGNPRVRNFAYSTASFRSLPVDLELDWEQGVTPVLQVDTCAHPDRPGSLPCETLTIEQVYERAGFDINVTPGGAVPIQASGAKPTWSDFELHDTMEVYWSHFAPQAQWAIWTFFAALHDDLPPEEPGLPPVPGDALLGIMFDTGLTHAGVEERQGCALFTDAIAAYAPPPTDPTAPAWLARETFFTAVHEMGHCFNLAHSFDKSFFNLGWIPLEDEPEARSFMNYPFTVQGGETAFYKRFKYRFSSQELTFLRHARSAFVRPGSSPFFFDHGLVGPDTESGLSLRLRANRERSVFEFMEPVALELKLTNVSRDSMLVDRRTLSSREGMAVLVQRDRGPARLVRPYAQRCFRKEKAVIEPERSMYAPLRISAGLDGWEIAEPGDYTVQVLLQVDREEVLSNPLRLRVTPPRDYEEERIAQDFFSDDVGRIVTFNGSGVLDRGNDTLREVAERLPDSRAALHARLALGNPLARDTKRIEPDEGGGESRMRIEVDPARPEEGQALLAEALIEEPARAVESFGHIRWKRQVDSFSDLLADRGETDMAARVQDVVYDTLSKREVQGSRIVEPVLRDVERRRERYRGA
jgi:hypothetical protein